MIKTKPYPVIPRPDQSNPFNMVSKFFNESSRTPVQSKHLKVMTYMIYDISYIEITLINYGVKTHILLIIHVHNLCEKKIFIYILQRFLGS